jgi:cell division protease FtsH
MRNPTEVKHMRHSTLVRWFTIAAVVAPWLTCHAAHAQPTGSNVIVFEAPSADESEERALTPKAPASPEAPVTAMIYSDFVSCVDRGEVREVTVSGSSATGELTNGKRFRTIVPSDPDMINRLLTHRVRVTIAADEGWFAPGGLMTNWLPLVVVVMVMVFMGYRSQNRGNGATAFGRSRAHLLTQTSPRITFADVAGIEEAEQEVAEIVQYLKNPQKFQRLGGRMPKGVLLVGPPGTGKTLLARAVAGEAGVPFFTISGSDFVEMYVGVGAARVRDMFKEGKKSAPCIIFIDEIDAVGRHRGAVAGSEEREQTVNQLLVEMDGFEANENVIVIAATNRPDVLDSALLRPGRFDRQVTVSHPDVMGRHKILQVHMRAVPLDVDVDCMILARGTPGFSGADLAHLVNEAALFAARSDRANVTCADFERAKDRVLMGAERRSLTITPQERDITAYHEAGHALVAFHSPAHDPVHKVSIVPRGRSLGVTISLPEADRQTFSRRQLESRIAMLFGGRAAEELIFGREEVTTGASDDIRQATTLARRMVTEFGFSDKLGAVYLEGGQDMLSGASASISSATALAVDKEIQRAVDTGHEYARYLLTAHIGDLRALAQALIERETLSGDEVRLLLTQVSAESVEQA